MPRRPRILSRLLLASLLLAATGGALWFGLIPQRWSPLPPLRLDDSSPWFLDFRLAALRNDRDVCNGILKVPQIEASPIPDRPIQNRCGWENAVRVSAMGNANLPVDSLTCEMAAATAHWMTHAAQPLAVEILGSRITGVQHLGSYSCRNIVGNTFWKDFRSQHALANALDISGFNLEDGRQISVLRDWHGNGDAAKFLRAVHNRACRYFRVAIGPDFNPSHKDHFHFDRGVLWTCK